MALVLDENQFVLLSNFENHSQLQNVFIENTFQTSIPRNKSREENRTISVMHLDSDRFVTIDNPTPCGIVPLPDESSYVSIWNISTLQVLERVMLASFSVHKAHILPDRETLVFRFTIDPANRDKLYFYDLRQKKLSSYATGRKIQDFCVLPFYQSSDSVESTYNLQLIHPEENQLSFGYNNPNNSSPFVTIQKFENGHRWMKIKDPETVTTIILIDQVVALFRFMIVSC